MNKKIKILGIAGSIHLDSFNKILIETAKNLCPQDEAEIEILDIKNIPMFDRGKEDPEIVTDAKNKIKSADAILIATPEYNNSIPGVLKNFIDWISYPNDENPFDNKPMAIMSASTGIFGGARAQNHLKQILSYLNALIINKPEVYIPTINDKVTDNKITDPHTMEKVEELLKSLIEWTRKISL